MGLYEFREGMERQGLACCLKNQGFLRQRLSLTTQTRLNFIGGFGVLTSSRVRHITSLLSWRPASAGNEQGAKWLVNQWLTYFGEAMPQSRSIPVEQLSTDTIELYETFNNESDLACV